MSQCCFGVEPRKDGSVVVASEEGKAARVELFRAEQVSRLVQLIHEKSPSPRVCIASIGRHALNLALAFAALPAAEVILLRPAALRGRGFAGNGGRETDVALALARYARRAA
jgi:hypothetical protein